jgi:DegV family protein with EDD domain
MSAYRITTDSTVDLNPSRMRELDIPYVALHFLLEGKDITDDMTEATAKMLYDAMREGKVSTTSQATVESFVELWTPILENGEDILYIGFSSALSGTVNSSVLARQQLLEKYPDRKIFIIDSLCASSGEGMIVEHAAALKEGGMELEALYQEIETRKMKVHHWFTVDDLVYLRRGGRVSGAAALFASLLSIKPVMNTNSEGKLIPREKIKGRRGAIKRLYELLVEKIDQTATTFINISHADCIEDANQLKQLIHEGYPHLPVNIYSVGAVIGSHSGPGTLALFFMGTPRTV